MLSSPKRLIAFKHLIKPDVARNFQPGAFVRAPFELVALVAKVIAAWSYVDVGITHLASVFLTLDFEPVAEMFSTLRAFNVRRGLLNAAMKRRTIEDKRLFLGTMGIAEAAEGRRNWYAHGLWGYNASLPDALLLLDSREAAHDAALTLANALETGEWPDWKEQLQYEANMPDEDLERIRVFTAQDLQADFQEIAWISGLMSLLDLALSPRSHPEESVTARAMLLSILHQRRSSQRLSTEKTPPPQTR